jgi:hypothetical protein
MYTLLSLLAIGIGLLVMTALSWQLWQLSKTVRANPEEALTVHLVRQLSRWTWLDSAICGLLLLGILFMLADLLAMYRDRHLYPLYHFGYLLSAFFYSLIGVIFLLARLLLLLRFAEITATASASVAQTTPDSVNQTADIEN